MYLKHFNSVKTVFSPNINTKHCLCHQQNRIGKIVIIHSPSQLLNVIVKYHASWFENTLFIDSYIVLCLQEANYTIQKVRTCILKTLILDVKLKMNNGKIEFILILSPSHFQHISFGIGNGITFFADNVRLLSQYDKYLDDKTIEKSVEIAGKSQIRLWQACFQKYWM